MNDDMAKVHSGKTIAGIYEVLSNPIEGGMGSVTRVHHSGWGLDLAMKQPHTHLFQSDEQRETFIRECDAWINLGLHSHIVSCYYVRNIDGMPSIFSEWMEGGSLADWMRPQDGDALRLYADSEAPRLYIGSEREQLMRILDIAIQYARGLHYSHEHGLIHQDVKPDNVLLTVDGTAKVADFGIAQARAKVLANPGGGEFGRKTPHGVNATDECAIGGTMISAAGAYTPAYCSPEQMAGGELTRRTDIYSWAVTVLEMLLGNRPWPNGVVAGVGCHDYFDMVTLPVPVLLFDLLSECLSQKDGARPHGFAEVESRLLDTYEEALGTCYDRPVPVVVADSAETLNNRALSYLDLGFEEEAEECWYEALRVDQTCSDAMFNNEMRRWRTTWTDFEHSALVMQTMLANNPTDPQVMWLFANFCIESCQFARAAELLEEVVRYDAFAEAQVLLDYAREKASKSAHDPLEFHSATGIAFSQDGSRFVVASQRSIDHFAYPSMKKLLSITWSKPPITPQLLSPGARYLIAKEAGADHYCVWDAERATVVREFPRELGFITCFDKTGEGFFYKEYFTEKRVGKVALCYEHVVTGELFSRLVLSVEPDDLACLTVSDDACLAAIIREDEEDFWAEVYTMAGSLVMRSLCDGRRYVDILFTPDNTQLVIREHTGETQLIDIASSALVHARYPQEFFSAEAPFSFSPDGAFVFGVSDKVGMWDTHTYQNISVFDDEVSHYATAAFHPTEAVALICFDFTTVKVVPYNRAGDHRGIYSLSQIRSIDEVRSYAKQAEDLAAGITGCIDARCITAALSAFEQLRSIPGYATAPLTQKAGENIGRYCRKVGLRKLYAADNIYPWRGYGFSMHGAAFSADGRYFYTDARLFETTTRNFVHRFEGAVSIKACFSPQDADRLFVDGCVYHTEDPAYPVIDLRPSLPRDDVFGVAAYTPDGAGLLASNGGEEMLLFPADSTKSVFSFSTDRSSLWAKPGSMPSPELLRPVFSENSHYAAWCIAPGTIAVADLFTGEVIHRIKLKRPFDFKCDQEARELLAGPGNTLIVRGQGTLCAWDMETGESIFSLGMAEPCIGRVCISPDRSVLIVSRSRYAESGGPPHVVEEIDARSGETRVTLMEKKEDEYTIPVCISADGSFALIQKGEMLHYWDTQKNKSLGSMWRRYDHLLLHPNGTYAVECTFGNLNEIRFDNDYAFSGFGPVDEAALPLIGDFLAAHSVLDDRAIALLMCKLQFAGFGHSKLEEVLATLADMRGAIE